jgi:hypothetical protein
LQAPVGEPDKPRAPFIDMSMAHRTKPTSNRSAAINLKKRTHQVRFAKTFFDPCSSVFIRG